jgi:Cft2 family RNA processing exonuclease
VTELQCQLYGAGHGDEGVCVLVNIGPYRLLLDCGLQDISALVQDVQSQGSEHPPQLVICSHAHPDHSRGLLALHQQLPQLPIYASDVTTQLLPFNWLDQPEQDNFCHALPWRSPVELHEGLTVQLFPSGHLPGAASVLLRYTTPERTYTLFYTGDFLLSNSRLVEGFPLDEMRGLRPDVLLVEGSYGTARHPHRRQQENQLATQINQAIAQHDSILMPVPMLGLGQEILMLLRSHHHFTGQRIAIWVDETVAIGCDAYIYLLPHLPSTVQNFARHQSLFWDERIRPWVRRLPTNPQEAQRAIASHFPRIVLMGSDAPLEQYCTSQNGSWLLLLPQQPGEGDDVESKIHQQLHHNPALRQLLKSGQLKVDSYLLSDHCDGPGTTQLIHNLRPQHVVFLHGVPNYLADLTGLEELQTRYKLHCPQPGKVVELPIGENFIQPAAPETRYEGMLEETNAAIQITLPPTITSDPRWQHFADTGLVDVRWQGNELVLRGVLQRELLNQATPALAEECCGQCQYFRRHKCANQASPLYGFKVTPEGYCPAFEAIATQYE